MELCRNHVGISTRESGKLHLLLLGLMSTLTRNCNRIPNTMPMHSSRRRASSIVAGAVALSCNISIVLSFSSYPSRRRFGAVPSASHHDTSPQFHPPNHINGRPQCITPLFMSGKKFEKMNEDDDQVIAFMETDGDKGIDCYVDSYATVDGVEYTIGSPCDYAVALCYFEEDEQLVPIELDDPLMDDIFPIAESIIEDEFGEELVLLRTPQTLTLVGVSCIAMHSLSLLHILQAFCSCFIDSPVFHLKSS